MFSKQLRFPKKVTIVENVTILKQKNETILKTVASLENEGFSKM